MNRELHAMSLRIASALILLLSLCANAVTRAADFTVDEWFIGSTVDGSQYDLVFDDVVQNPYDELLQAISPVPNNASFTDGRHQISWNDDSGVFRLDGAMAAEHFGTHFVTAASSARILITPTSDLVIRYSGRFAFHLPAEDTRASLSLLVFDANSSLSILQTGFAWDSFLGLGARSFDYEGEIVMPAGRTWVLKYSMGVTAFPNSAGHVATGSGFAEFRILPEPATAAMTFGAAVLSIGRGRRRRRNCSE